jgi:hypothetical protein
MNGKSFFSETNCSLIIILEQVKKGKAGMKEG